MTEIQDRITDKNSRGTMQDNSENKTVYNNYVSKRKYIKREYGLTKNKNIRDCVCREDLGNCKIGEHTPSVSTVYRIERMYGVSRMQLNMKQNRRKIIKQRAEELGHIDCYHSSKNLVLSSGEGNMVLC